MWYDGLFELLEERRDTAQSEKMAAYMQNRFPFLGIPSPELRLIFRPFIKEAKKLPPDFGFVDECYLKPYREAQYLAVQYVVAIQKKLQKSDLPRLKKMLTEKPWWDTVDNLDAAIGFLVLESPELKSEMLEWALSDDLWLRRTAIDFQQEYKELTDTVLLEEIILKNLGTTEFFINKAIGWSLRDYSKTDPEWVRSFLLRHGEKLAPLSRKEAAKGL